MPIAKVAYLRHLTTEKTRLTFSPTAFYSAPQGYPTDRPEFVSRGWIEFRTCVDMFVCHLTTSVGEWLVPRVSSCRRIKRSRVRIPVRADVCVMNTSICTPVMDV
ncbi:hypothetical protein evm_003609 [Chilo suppressalis]|nr:hypothetical protein evm_003609 [Chilo suppressalis]